MDRHIKTKLITTLVCLLISLIAIYAFIFIIEVQAGWRVVLILVAIFWIISGIANLKELFENSKR